MRVVWAPAEMPPREMESGLMFREVASSRAYSSKSDMIIEGAICTYPFQRGKRVLKVFAPQGFYHTS